MKIVFIRHGDPDYSIDSLTPKGWAEAEMVAARVENMDVKDFYVSPLGRAQDTARVTLEHMGRSAKTLDYMQEFAYMVKDPKTGEDRIPWDFMPDYWTRKEEFYSKDLWMESEVMKSGDIAQKYEEVTNKFDQLLEEYGYNRMGNFYQVSEGNEDTIVIFCHLGVEFVILSHLLGISPVLLWQGFFVAPTSVTELCTEEREHGKAYFRCKCLGDTSHLYIKGENPSNSGFFRETYK